MVETFLGEELTAERAAALASGPVEHLELLAAEKLVPHYYDWLEQESQARAADATPVYHAVDPYPREGHSAAQHRLKALLLYFPHVALTDPISDVLWPAATSAQIQGMFGGSPVFELRGDIATRSRLRDALIFLAQVRPFVQDGSVRLIPATFALDYSSIQEAVRAEVETLEHLPEALKQHYGATPLVRHADPCDRSTVGMCLQIRRQDRTNGAFCLRRTVCGGIDRLDDCWVIARSWEFVIRLGDAATG